MVVLRSIFIYSNFWVSLCAASLAYVTPLLAGGRTNIWVALLVFFATMMAYNFQRISRLGTGNFSEMSAMHQWIVRRQNVIIGLMLASGAGVAVCLFFVKPVLLYILIPAGLLSVNYTVSFLKGKRSSGLRDIPALKIFMIACVWVMATVWIPLIEMDGFNVLKEPDFWMLSVERFLFVVAITIPFDIRDLKYDEPDKKTLPQLIGASKSVALSIILLLCSGVLLFMASDGFDFTHAVIESAWVPEYAGHYLHQQAFMPGTISIFGVMYLTVACMLLFSNPRRKEGYFTLLVESASFLYAGAVLAAYCYTVFS